MIPCPSFKIPKGMSKEQYLLNHIAEGDTDITIEADSQ